LSRSGPNPRLTSSSSTATIPGPTTYRRLGGSSAYHADLPYDRFGRRTARSRPSPLRRSKRSPPPALGFSRSAGRFNEQRPRQCRDDRIEVRPAGLLGPTSRFAAASTTTIYRFPTRTITPLWVFRVVGRAGVAPLLPRPPPQTEAYRNSNASCSVSNRAGDFPSSRNMITDRRFEDAGRRLSPAAHAAEDQRRTATSCLIADGRIATRRMVGAVAIVARTRRDVSSTRGFAPWLSPRRPPHCKHAPGHCPHPREIGRRPSRPSRSIRDAQTCRGVACLVKGQAHRKIDAGRDGPPE